MKLRKMFNRKTEFRARSPERDNQTDNQYILPIIQAIEVALQRYEAESAGLDGRIAAAGLRASFLVGNDTDEYLSRDAADSEQLSRDETEFKNGHRRLEVLREHILKLQDIRTNVLSKFPIAQYGK